MFYVDLDGFQLVGASPETQVRVEDGVATVGCIAGTRPRGATPEEDLAMEEEMVGSPKERAEHVMLVDLARNDLGRVSRVGGVTVNALMTVERYSHVMHLESNVDGADAGRPHLLRRLPRLFAAGDGLRRAQDSRHGDHRRPRTPPPRPLLRRHRLLRVRGQHGHLRRPSHPGD